MATVYYSGNSIRTKQVRTLTVTLAGVGGTLTATINGKSVTYTCVTGDTVTTAATAWFALLGNTSTAPPEFNVLVFANPSAGVITVTEGDDGPFTMTNSSGGGATVSAVATTAHASPEDVSLAANWLRSALPALPQNGDDLLLQDNAISLLWNLNTVASVQLATYKRFQTQTGTIGLPEQNPNGYLEYRPTYLKLSGPPGTASLPMTLGIGAGSGPSRERYDLQTQRLALVVYASGSPADDFAVRILNINVNSTVSVLSTSVGIAWAAAEISTIGQADVSAGGTLGLGAGVTLTGTGSATSSGSSGSALTNPGVLTVNSAQAILNCIVTTLRIYAGAAVTVQTQTGTFPTVLAQVGSTITWNGGGTISTLTLNASCTFDKSGSTLPLTITNSTIDGDTCQILDPLSTITYTNATTINNIVNSGPFVTGPNRTMKVV